MILITRPKAEADETAAKLKALGYECCVEPLLMVEPLPNILSEQPLQAALFTSGYGIKYVPEWVVQAQPIVLTVGDKTAAAAHSKGFLNVISAQGDVEDVYKLALNMLDKDGPSSVHFCGVDQVGDLAGWLHQQGFKCGKHFVYKASEQTTFSKTTVDKIERGLVRSTLFFSPRTAKVFMQIIRSQNLESYLDGMTAFCLSEAVAEPLYEGGWRQILKVKSPDQASMFKLIESVYR